MIKFSEKAFRDKIKWSPDYDYIANVPKIHPAGQVLNIFDKILNKEIDFNKLTMAAGTRFGKSALCGYICVREIAKNIIRLRNKENVKPIKIWIVAPTYDLADKVFDYVARFFSIIFPDWGGNISRRVPQSIKLPFGIKIECKSGDSPEGMLGDEIDLAIIDECSRLKRNIWESYLSQRLGSRQGKAIFISTPFGQNWFYEMFMKCKQYGTAFQFTSKDNPYYPIEAWKEAENNLPHQVFQQEHMASFLPDAAAVFRGVDEIVEDCSADVVKDHYYILGVDLGKHRDFTALTVIDTILKKMVYFDRFNQIEYPFQKKRIKATADRYNNARIIVDSTGVGEPIRDDLARERLFVDDFKFTKLSKKELVEKLSIFIENKYIKILPNQILIDEIKAFGYKLTEAGNIIYGAPQGLHDDCVISLALAVWGLNPGNPQQDNKLKKEIQKRSKENNQSFI